ncbi:MAG: hypothetical protein V3R51_06875 [Gammaproteobacteria bacterium]
MRITYTMALMVLGVGYLFAMIHTFASHAGRDGNPMLSVQDLIIAYSGSKSETQLEMAIQGPMAPMLPQNEAAAIRQWLIRGTERAEFDTIIKPIIENRCLRCHDGTNPHILDLRGFAKVLETTEADTGMDLFTLVRVSHIHLFGLTFIFFIVSTIFCHSYVRYCWFKALVISIPFLAIIADIASWYMTKVYEPFAWVVLVSGGLMGICFAIEWLISIYQMWFYKLPPELASGKIQIK